MRTKNRANSHLLALWYKPNKEGRNFNTILIAFVSPKIYHARVVNYLNVFILTNYNR